MLGDANQIDNVTIIWNDVFEASAFGIAFSKLPHLE